MLLLPLSPRDGLLLAVALALAWALDRLFGEPPDRWHPVAWFGNLAGPAGVWLKRLPARQAFLAGTGIWLLAALTLGGLALVLQRLLLQAPVWLGLPLLALLMKPLFAWRMLRDEVAAVDTALTQGLDAARRQLARLVSRNTQLLDEGQLRETAIETLAENLNDSLVAPLFWLLVAGLPGMVVYRMANTLDAMWGYRGDWEWAGKFSARADDLLSWPSARLTAILLMPMRFRPWLRLVQEARHTPSPNGGWSMGAMALCLGVRLGKPGVYVLNAGAPPPQAVHLQQALRLGQRAARSAVLATVLLLCALPLLDGLPRIGRDMGSALAGEVQR